ncbi:hypothetical protein ACLBWZ_15960 [Brucellaceae bacterium C25G]
MKNKIRQNALYATVAASALLLNIASSKDVFAQVVINYTGTQAEYDALSWEYPGKSVRPPASGEQSGNTVTVSDPDGLGGDFVAPGYVFGGYQYDSNPEVTVNDNLVIITGGVIEYEVTGGHGQNHSEGSITVSGNRVEISAGEIGSSVQGGSGGGYISSDGTMTVSGNSVDISGGVVGGAIYGGIAAIYNSHGQVNTQIIVNDNSVVISGDTQAGYYITGGESRGYDATSSLVSNNSVVVTDNAVAGYVAGGAGDGLEFSLVSDNSVEISGNAVVDVVIGGEDWSDSEGNVSNNSVVISGNARTGDLIGGRGNSWGQLTVSGNRVEVFGGEIYGDVYGGSGGGYISSGSELMISGNRVEISGGEIDGDIHAGYAFANLSDDGAGEVEVSDNNLVISGGEIEGNAYGGLVYNLIYDEDNSSNVHVSNNEVTLKSGAYVMGDVYGGAIITDDYVENSYISISTTNNIVTLEEGAIVEENIYGGYALFNDNEVNDWDTVVAGNTLNINSYSGSVKGIYNFENYNWVLPKTFVNNGAMIEITGSDAVNLDNTKHTIAVVNDGTRLKVNDTIVMIDKASGEPASTPDTVPDEIRQGHFIIYDVDVKVDDEGKFVLKVLGVEDDDDGGRVDPRAKVFLEGRAAALGFVSQGSDLIATAGIDNIRMMGRSKEEEYNHIPFIPFMIMKGNSIRYKTGSHADVDGFHMATGLAVGGEFEQGNKVTTGVFFEYGRGTYDTYNSFVDYGSVHGDGDVHYTGGGVFGRLDFAGTGLGRVPGLPSTRADGLYLEASLRAGRVSMGFNSGDLIDLEGNGGNYNSKFGYIGGHASVGYAFNFDEQQSLDVYGRYLWTRMNGDTVSVGNDTLHFDKSTSSRIQLGGRYGYVYNDQFKPYLGATYEYEFKGDIGATAYGLRIDKPSLKGGTGIVEAGFTFTPNLNLPTLSLDVNGQAFFGERRGGSGQIKLKYQF